MPWQIGTRRSMERDRCDRRKTLHEGEEMHQRNVALLAMLSVAAGACGGVGSSAEHTEGAATISSTPTLKEIEPFSYCAIEARGSWSQQRDKIAQLNQAVAEQAVPVQGEVLGVWYSYPDETAEEDRVWEVGYRVEDGVTVSEPLVIKRWETRQVYSQIYDGPAGESGEFFENYWAWFEENDMRVVRPLLEVDLPQPESTESGASVPKFEAMVAAEPVGY